MKPAYLHFLACSHLIPNMCCLINQSVHFRRTGTLRPQGGGREEQTRGGHKGGRKRKTPKVHCYNNFLVTFLSSFLLYSSFFVCPHLSPDALPFSSLLCTLIIYVNNKFWVPCWKHCFTMSTVLSCRMKYTNFDYVKSNVDTGVFGENCVEHKL